MTYPNVAITGAMRSGKDVIAAYLTQKYGYTRFAFGDGIREVTRRLYPQMYVNGEKPRALLQSFGQMARTFDNAVWINDMFRRIDNDEYTRYSPVVCSDLRQPDEYSALKERGYVIIRVKAPSALRIQRAVESADTFTYADLTHDTESHTDGFAVDYEVVNDGTLDELYAQVDAVIAEITNRQR